MFSLPAWIAQHLYTNKNFGDLTREELSTLQARIAKFKSDEPEVSVVIPAWNEQNNIYRTLSSIAASNTTKKVEIIVINNNSTDNTQQVLDTLGVRSYLQTEQGTPFARQMGLEKAKGKYHLCADSDTLYPPDWIDLMVAPMKKDAGITGVYARYSYIPPDGKVTLGIKFYEFVVGLLVQLRKKNREYMNVFGFNMGFVTAAGLNNGGFKVSGNRKFNNVSGSDYMNEAEDGRMALNLKKTGRLQLVNNKKARVYTSPRRLLDDGSLTKAFTNRAKVTVGNMKDYIFGKNQS